MGLLCSRVHQAFQSFYGMKSRIFLLGLDDAGKTTLLYRLKLNETVMTIPTIGFNVENITVQNITFTMYDFGGGDKIKFMWRHYYADTQGVVFVVDSVDSSRFEEASFELQERLCDCVLQEVPLVLLANKQDLPGARPPMEVAEQMGLRNVDGQMYGHQWHVQGCCAVSGEGLSEALAKLAEMVKDYQKTDRASVISKDMSLSQNTVQ